MRYGSHVCEIGWQVVANYTGSKTRLNRSFNFNIAWIIRRAHLNKHQCERFTTIQYRKSFHLGGTTRRKVECKPSHSSFKVLHSRIMSITKDLPPSPIDGIWKCFFKGMYHKTHHPSLIRIHHEREVENRTIEHLNVCDTYQQMAAMLIVVVRIVLILGCGAWLQCVIDFFAGSEEKGVHGYICWVNSLEL